MPLAKLSLRPGINTLATQTLNEGGWSDGNLIRFFQGFLQKYGGNEKLAEVTLGGLCRGIHAYQDINGNDYLLMGSTVGLQVLLNGTLYTLYEFGDELLNLNVPWLASTNGSNIYTVTHASHGQTVGKNVNFYFPASVDNVVLWNGTYPITQIVNANQFRITASGTTATSTDSGGEPALFTPLTSSDTPSVVITVTLPGHGLVAGDIFPVIADKFTGAGIEFTVGEIPPGNYLVREPVTANTFVIHSSEACSGTAKYQYEPADIPAGLITFQEDWPGDDVNWFIDNFGTQTAVFCYANGPLLSWTPPPTTNIAVDAVINAPTINSGMLVAMPQAQVISWGAETNGLQDPLLLRWCDAGQLTTWVASITNQAGSFRLSRGSRIVGARQAAQLTLVWTDIELWAMQYIGPPLVYSFTIMAAGCGLKAPRAHAQINNTTYWLSQKQFFTFGAGGVQVLPCSVWDFIFNDIDESEAEFIFAAPNSSFTEVSWFFRSASTGNIHYVKHDVLAKTWDYGTSLDRTAWIDQSVFGTPIATSTDLTIQQQESGYDDDATAMSGAFAESGFIELAEGDSVIYIDEMIPDMAWFGTGGYVTVTFWAVNYPSDTPVMYGPYVVTPQTRFIRLDCRARQIAFRIDWGAAAGFSARFGGFKFRPRFAGRMP